jgi:hypothetical protein
MVAHRAGRADRQSRFDPHLHQPGQTMNHPVHPVILRYAAGELSANQAAGLLGDPATVADVLMMAREAGLQPPPQPAHLARAELARARMILGLDPIATD